jgi:hypothetical protein
MMNKSVYSGRRRGIIVIQNCSPIPESAVGSYYDRATFIAGGDDLQEEFGPPACPQVDSLAHR